MKSILIKRVLVPLSLVAMICSFAVPAFAFNYTYNYNGYAGPVSYPFYTANEAKNHSDQNAVVTMGTCVEPNPQETNPNPGVVCHTDNTSGNTRSASGTIYESYIQNNVNRGVPTTLVLTNEGMVSGSRYMLEMDPINVSVYDQVHVIGAWNPDSY